MTSERIPQMAIATALVFATVIFLEPTHQFILPFGLYKIGIFICAVAVLIAEKKKPQLTEWLLLGWTFILAITSTFVLQFFFSEDQALDHEAVFELILSLLQIVGFALILLWQLAIAKKDAFLPKVLQIIGAVGMFVCLLPNNTLFYYWLIAPTIIWFFGLAMQKTKSSSYGMSLLLFFVIVSCWISGLFFGLDSVVAQL